MRIYNQIFHNKLELKIWIINYNIPTIKMFIIILFTFVIMISVLLPIYNYRCVNLLNELFQQLHASSVPFEIIVMEDGSLHHIQENRQVAESLGCRYILLSHNVGRAAIRNRLAIEARYEWLLFMDCDSRLLRTNYIATYLHHAKLNSHWVICGGRTFGKKEQTSPEYLLHWYCGSLREPKPTDNNSQKPFLSNNFMIHKSVFKKVRFEEELKEYGHEDTLFGFALRRANFDILYIDNPVFHEGLDNNEVFLMKSRMAVINLRHLKERYLNAEDCNQIRLLRFYDKLQPFYLDRVFMKIYEWMHKPIEKQLKSKKPNLYLFDLYKFGFLCKIMQTDRPLLHKTDR